MKLKTLDTIRDYLEQEVFRTSTILLDTSKSQQERLDAADANARLSAALEDLKTHDFH